MTTPAPTETPEGSLGGIWAAADEPWKQALAQLAVRELAVAGHEGLAAVPALVARIRAGNPVNLQSLSLREASDLLAALQIDEAEHNKRIDAFVHALTLALTEAVKVLVGAYFNKVTL